MVPPSVSLPVLCRRPMMRRTSATTTTVQQRLRRRITTPATQAVLSSYSKRSCSAPPAIQTPPVGPLLLSHRAATTTTSYCYNNNNNNNWNHGGVCRLTTTTKTNTNTNTASEQSTTTDPNKKRLYLHVGPSGDSWIGDAIFAAKHNQPGYVKSIPLSDAEEGNILVEILEEHPEWAYEIYDTECLPEALKEHLIQLVAEDDTKQ